MFDLIVVPVDGSRFAEAALPHARHLARTAGGAIRLVMAHHVLPAWSPALGFPDAGASLEQETRAREEQYLSTLAAAEAAASGRPVSTALVDGAAGDALVHHIEASGAGLVVMATHGRGPASRFWLGSTTDYVLRHVQVPVLVVRPDGDGAAAPLSAGEKILVPIDASDLSETVIAPAAQFARLLRAHLILLSIVEPAIGSMDPSLPFPSALDPAAIEAQRAESEARLERIASGLRTTGLQVECRLAVALGVAASILEVLEREGIGLVAMSTHGQGGLRRALIGSVTDKVIRGAQKPVLAWRPPS